MRTRLLCLLFLFLWMETGLFAARNGCDMKASLSRRDFLHRKSIVLFRIKKDISGLEVETVSVAGMGIRYVLLSLITVIPIC